MKKVVHTIKVMLTWLLVIVSIGMMIFTIISVTTFDRTERSLFGYRSFIVLSDSMSKTDFNSGDLILVKEVDPSTLQVGDIISYTSTDTENYGEVITHKIRTLTTDENGNSGFITYGTTTDTDDKTIVTYDYVLGKYEIHIPKVGTLFQFLKTVPGYICCIFIPFMILILLQSVNSIKLFREYKAQQKAELQLEREEIEKEKAEVKKAMEEVLKLKEELTANKNVENSN